MRFAREECGQAVVLIGLALSALLLGLGLAVDTGELYVARRAAQTAADAAAWAGAVVITNGGTAAAAQAAAAEDATRNGYSSGVTAVVPPAGGVVAGDTQFIEVTLSTEVRTFFFPGPRTVAVRAVAGAARSGSGEAVLVLRGDAASGALDMQNNSFITTTGAGVHVNSTHGDAVTIAGGGFCTVQLTSTYTRVVGGVRFLDECQVSPFPPTEGYATALADPYVNLPLPPAGPVRDPDGLDLNNQVTTLDPGIYHGGIRIRGASNVTLNPGVYVMRAGAPNYGFTVQNTSRVQVAGGGGVLIVLTHQNYPAAPGPTACNTFDLNTTGGVGVVLQPATTGAYAGLLVYQDRACTLGGTDAQVRGAGPKTLTGTIYWPRSRLIVSGGSTFTWNAQLVVRELRTSTNNTRLNLTFVPASVRGNRVPALVE